MNCKTKTLLFVIAGVAAILIVALVVLSSKEAFQNLGVPADVPDGVYTIRNNAGLSLTSNIIDPVQCNDFLIGQTYPSSSTDWKLKRVAQGVYIFYKQGEKECMYTHPTDSLRSYFFPSCNTKNMCGLETPDYKGDLDKESLRTYFMLLKHPQGKYYIRSMKNNRYLKMTDKSLDFSDKPSEECLFDISPTVQ